MLLDTYLLDDTQVEMRIPSTMSDAQYCRC